MSDLPQGMPWWAWALITVAAVTAALTIAIAIELLVVIPLRLIQQVLEAAQ